MSIDPSMLQNIPPEIQDALFNQAMGGQTPPPPPDGILAPPPLETPGQRERARRIRPFELPETKPKPAPSIDQIIAWKNQRVSYWAGRDERMRRHERLYLMLDAGTLPPSGKKGEERIVSNYGRAIVDKLSYMVGRQRARIKTYPRAQTPEHVMAAQNCEDFLYDLERHADEKHIASGHQSMARDEAWFAGCRGWLVSRVYLDYNSIEQPICYEIRDPICCYPRFGRVGIGYLRDMIVHEQTDVVTFLAANPKYIDHEYFKDKDDQDTITITWYEDCWNSVLIADDSVELDSYQHNYGFCPWVVDLAGGSPSDIPEARDQRGSGLLAPLTHMISYRSRMYSQLATGMARYGNPPTMDIVQPGSPYPAPLDISPGARNRRTSDQDTRILEVREDINHAQILASFVEQELARGGLPDILWGDPSGLSGGFHQAVATQAAEDALFPFADCIIKHRQKRNSLAMAMVLVAERQGILEPEVSGENPEAMPEPGIVYRRPNREAYPRRAGRRQAEYVYSVLKPDDVRLHGLENEVQLRRMTPSDLLAIGQFASMMATSGLLDMTYVRDRYLDVDDPVAVNNRALYDQLYKDEEIVKNVFIPRMLAQLDPELLAWLQFNQAQKQRQQAQPPPAPPQPAPPVPPQAPQAPLPAVPGFNDAQLPNELQFAQGVPGFPGDPAAIQALIQAMMQPVQPGQLPAENIP
jgi:hypothetical protein